MDIFALSRKHLEDAVELGYITVNGKELPLTAPQILAIAKSIVKDTLVSVDTTEDVAPTEMFSSQCDEERIATWNKGIAQVKAALKPRHDYEESLSILESDY